MPIRTVKHTDSSTSWLVLASDGTAYTSLAALQSAGKTPFPGLDAGITPDSILLQCKTGTFANGEAFLVAFNRSTAPTDSEAIVLSSGQEYITIEEHGPGRSPLNYTNVWFRKTTGTDHIIASVGWGGT